MFSWVEISESAIRHNLQQFKKNIGKKNLLMPVIKSNAYGHGLDLISKICDTDKNVSKICVVNSDEAVRLLELKIKKPVLILSFYTKNKKELEKLIDRGVEFPIYRFDQITFLNTLAKTINKKVNIHIKIDTGTSRVGFLLSDLKTVAALLKKSKWLNIEGVWSHFASSEDNTKFTIKQNDTFKKALQILSEQGIEANLKHMACTSASLSFDFNNLNATRLGLGLYGLYPDEKSRKVIKLKPALSWKAEVIQVKTLPKGAKIGYGGSFTTTKKTKIVILPVGYWDGYIRNYSNTAKVIIKGKICPVRGRICMNLTIVETPINLNVQPGDVATLIGKDGNITVTADDMACWSKTINYEVVTRINPLIPRLKVK